MNTIAGRAQIVILGGGFAGAYCARWLEKKLHSNEADVTLVNRTNFFAFTPMLIEAGTGSLEPRHAVIPIRQFLKGAMLRTAEVTAVDVERKQVQTRRFDDSEETIPYDHLVVSLGGVTRIPNVPGLSEYGCGMKSLADAVALRDRAVGLLELASETNDPERRKAMLTFVVVGGNFSGIEVAGELNEFLTAATSCYRNIRPDDIRIVIVDHESRILHILDEDLSQYASNLLQRRGIQLRLNNSVTRIEKDAADLGDGEKIPAWTVIWTAGIGPNPLLATIDLPLNQRGYIECNPDLQVRDRNGVWAIGDCASNPDPQGRPYPPTAQHAIQEGKMAAKNIIRSLRKQPTKPLAYRTRGMMAPLGRYRGVARIFGFKISGFPAWLLWRTFYLLKMPGISRSIRVMMDWTIDFFFSRDFVQLGIHGNHDPAAEPNVDENEMNLQSAAATQDQHEPLDS